MVDCMELKSFSVNWRYVSKYGMIWEWIVDIPWPCDTSGHVLIVVADVKQLLIIRLFGFL